jgi:hypothetical protein
MVVVVILEEVENLPAARTNMKSNRIKNWPVEERPRERLVAGGPLVSRLHEKMTQEERLFIVSIKEGKPRWDLLGVSGIENLPAIRWKLQNIRRMTPMKHREALRKLRDYLGA